MAFNFLNNVLFFVTQTMAGDTFDVRHFHIEIYFLECTRSACVWIYNHKLGFPKMQVSCCLVLRLSTKHAFKFTARGTNCR